MFLDIDNFKRVNDTYGHQVGDELLKAVTKDLQEIVPDAYIARIGGDEFVILIVLAIKINHLLCRCVPKQL